MASSTPEHARSYRNLENARQSAFKKSGYDSFATRVKLVAEFRARCGQDPYEWQLDVSEALLLGLDSIVIAKTGAGKTGPFMMPLMLDEKKKSIIISPLKVLQDDQATRFRKASISSVAVNGDTWNSSLQKDLKENKYQGILAGPEMCLRHSQFRSHLASTNFQDVCSLVVDEAHCISQWGGDFRTDYSGLSKLRAFFPPNIPILATSATLTPKALQEVRASLGIDPNTSFFLNLGNDRPNICYEAQQINNTDDFRVLKPHLLRSGNPSTPADLVKTIVFTPSVLSTQLCEREIASWLPEHLRPYVDYLNARRSPAARKEVFNRFRRGKVMILIATESAGMGTDVSDIELVIQFGLPPSLSIWIQRAGRAGRDPSLNARALLLYEKSMFEVQKKKARPKPPKKRQKTGPVQSEPLDSSDEEDHGQSVASGLQDCDGYEWRKRVEEGLRLWVQTDSCRRDIVDDYFRNPPGVRQRPTHACCDNCDGIPIRSITPDHTDASTPSTPTKSANLTGKRPMALAMPEIPNRVGNHLKAAKESLIAWRINAKRTYYSPGPMTATALLPDSVVKTLASAAHIQTLEAMRTSVSWMLTDRHGEEILALLRGVDRAEDERRAEADRLREARELETQAQKLAEAQKREEERRRREEARRSREEEKENARLEREWQKHMRELIKYQKAAEKAAGCSPRPLGLSNAVLSPPSGESSNLAAFSSPAGGLLDFRVSLLLAF